MRHKLSQVCHQNRYSQLDAESIMDLVSESTDVKLLPSSKNYDLFTSYDEAGDLVCNGEVITLGKARYANIKYWCGDFISSNNNVIESKDTGLLRSKYLYYFLCYTAKDYYVEATTYPKFDQKNFDNHYIDIPDIYIQDSRLEVLDSLSNLIKKETLQLTQLDELTKSRFIELFVNKGFGKIQIRHLVNPEKTSAKKTYKSNDEFEYIDISSIDNELNEIVSSTRYRLSNAPSRAQQCLKHDDILVSTVRPNLRNVAKFNGPDYGYVGSSGFCVLRANKCNPSYLMYNVLSDDFTDAMVKLTTGASYPAIRDDDVLDYKIIDAPLALQNEFGKFVKEIDKLKFSA